MKDLKKIFKIIKIAFILVVIIIPSIIIFGGLVVLATSGEQIEQYLEYQGEITNKTVVPVECCIKTYYFTLNDTIDVQTSACVYNDFAIGEYIYITNLGAVSKDGVSFTFTICDDFRNCCNNFTFFIIILTVSCVVVIIVSYVVVINRVLKPWLLFKKSSKKIKTEKM